MANANGYAGVLVHDEQTIPVRTGSSPAYECAARLSWS